VRNKGGGWCAAIKCNPCAYCHTIRATGDLVFEINEKIIKYELSPIISLGELIMTQKQIRTDRVYSGLKDDDSPCEHCSITQTRTIDKDANGLEDIYNASSYYYGCRFRFYDDDIHQVKWNPVLVINTIVYQYTTITYTLSGVSPTKDTNDKNPIDVKRTQITDKVLCVNRIGNSVCIFVINCGIQIFAWNRENSLLREY
jgi:hypothetical protein